jgi:glycosyltransferase involved in cell wall biosynthesis
MTVALSVVIPAHNPRRDYLERALAALRAQSLPQEFWELLVVDNESDPPLRGCVDLRWHSRAAVVREERLGLTHARVRGIRESIGNVIILVDDDNVLATDYLVEASNIASKFPYIGAWGGCIDPEFELPRIAPPSELNALLTLRQVSVDLWSNDPNHNASTPWGAGLCIRREVADAYVREVADNPVRTALDLRGKTLLYGGDTDIAYCGCRMGYAKGVFGKLRVTHLIPAERCTSAYLCRVARGRGYSEVLHGYALQGILPAPEPLSLSRVLHYIRSALKPGVQRSVAFAYLKGRRSALLDLTAEKAKLF